MSIEFILIIAGLLMFSVFAWQRWIGRVDLSDNQHLGVFANLGCVFVIIGFSALIIQTLTGMN